MAVAGPGVTVRRIAPASSAVVRTPATLVDVDLEVIVHLDPEGGIGVRFFKPGAVEWDTRLDILECLTVTLGDRFSPTNLDRRRVADDRLPWKSGHGLHRYEDTSSSDADTSGAANRQRSSAAVVD